MEGGFRSRRLGALAAAGLLIAACSGAEDPAEAESTTTPAPAEDSESVAPEPAEGSGVPVDEPAELAVEEPADDGAETKIAAAPTRCDPGTEPDGPVTLTIWHGLSGDVEQQLPVIVNEVEASLPGIEIELVTIDAGYPAVIQRLRETDPADAPDIVMSSEQTVRLQADSPRFVPVVECTGGETPDNLTDLLPVIRRTYTVDDVLWAAPFNVSTPVMLYDQKRWSRAGLDPSTPPADPAELEAVIRQLVDSGAATTGAVLFDRSGGWLLEEAAVQNGHALVEPDNGHGTVDVTGVALVADWSVDLLTRMQALKAEGYLLWAGLNPSSTDDLAQLVHPTEPSGLTFNTSAVLGDIVRLAESGGLPDVEIGVAPLPFGGVGATIGGGAWWLVDSGDPARVGAAWRVIDALTTPERIGAVAAYTGYVPTTPRAAETDAVVAAWERYPVFRVAYDQVAATPDTPIGAGIQVGPFTEVFRDLELAAAYPIDAGSDVVEQLEQYAASILEVLDLYRTTVGG